MKRRKLFSLLPAAAMTGTAAVSTSRVSAAPLPQSATPRIAAAHLSRAGFAISVQCWSFRQFTLFQALEMAAAAGAGGVEIFPGQTVGGPLGDAKVGPDLDEAALKAIREHAANLGIGLLNFGVTDIPKDEAEARKTYAFAKNLGLYGVTTESIDSIDTIEKLSKEFDIVTGFHNHPRKNEDPGYRMWDPDYVFDAVKNRDPRVGICADTGHWATSGLDPAAVLRKIAPRVVSFHMKDRASIEKHTHDRPFGTGILDLPGILASALDQGFGGNVSIEYEFNWDKSLPEIAQCVGYLRAHANLRAS